jgi:2-polyprenyl-3-methyl-5-hydroxy-6-metoxy-1,4-benzoquinol methylase
MVRDNKSNVLTSQNYWESYYKNPTTSRDQIISICSAYDQFWDKIYAANKSDSIKKILEVGGYPGRYLAYLASKYSLIPTSLDFNSDREKIDLVMKAFDVTDYNVIQADFLAHQPKEQYDIVISNGFIEHFEDYNQVMDKHVTYLKKGGTMLIMIPNKRWLRKWYGLLVDYKNLKAHNLKCMRKKVFIDFAERNNLELLDFTYFGGFAFTPHQETNSVQRLIYKMTRLIFKKINPFLEKRPNAFFSSSIIACYRK